MATSRKTTYTNTKTAAAWAKANAEDIQSETTPIVEKPLFARIDEWMEDKVGLRGIASWKRVITGWVVALLGAAGLGYLIGQVAAMLMVGALLTTGSLFLMYIIFALALVLSYWAGGKVGKYLFRGIVTRQWDFNGADAVFLTPRSI